MRRNPYEEYEYLPVEVIRSACEGDSTALSAVIRRYRSYAGKCFRTIAESKYELHMSNIPVDDLMQEVWIKLIEVIRTKFVIAC
ncbi:MAG: helix-turn-helix domain-containing protein [Lachnospiraceae bacterium]|nr:helix-turn-helix domain-containing protein [Lachnospiraceae bacterium]